jgi:hypothetical protein
MIDRNIVAWSPATVYHQACRRYAKVAGRASDRLSRRREDRTGVPVYRLKRKMLAAMGVELQEI